MFFVATPISSELHNQECEVSELIWANAEESLNLLTHDSDKQVVQKAIDYIKNLKNE